MILAFILLINNIGLSFIIQGVIQKANPINTYKVLAYDSQVGGIVLSTTNNIPPSLNYTLTIIDGKIVYKIEVQDSLNNILEVITSYNGWSTNTNLDIPLPITLEFFTDNIINNNNVKLQWKTSYEFNNQGFEIYRDNTKIGFVEGKNVPNIYNFWDNNLSSGIHYYKLRQIDYNANYDEFIPNINPIEIKIPAQTILKQNYPNPFNPTTKIDFTLSRANNVSLKIYDASGKEVSTLINSIYYKEGYYSINYNASNLASGIYFYKLYSNDFNIIKKMIVIK